MQALLFNPSSHIHSLVCVHLFLSCACDKLLRVGGVCLSGRFILRHITHPGVIPGRRKIYKYPRVGSFVLSQGTEKKENRNQEHVVPLPNCRVCYPTKQTIRTCLVVAVRRHGSTPPRSFSARLQSFKTPARRRTNGSCSWRLRCFGVFGIFVALGMKHGMEDRLSIPVFGQLFWRAGSIYPSTLRRIPVSVVQTRERNPVPFCHDSLHVVLEHGCWYMYTHTYLSPKGNWDFA